VQSTGPAPFELAYAEEFLFKLPIRGPQFSGPGFNPLFQLIVRVLQGLQRLHIV
jgi:hypothetical protein